MSEAGRRRALAAVATLGLCAGAPPSWFPGAPFLLFAGLLAFARLCRRERSARLVWIVGFLHLLWFSRSLWPVVGPGVVAIAGLGAVYGLLVRCWTRAGLRNGMPSLAFGCGVAATAWLRAHLPEIPYPHAQPCHAFHATPWLLGPVAWGGEALANLLLATLASSLGDLRSVRGRGVAIVLSITWAALCLLDPPRASAPSDAPASLRLAVFQSAYPLPDLPREAEFERFAALARATDEIAGRAAASPPSLVVWPESALPILARGSPPRLDKNLPLPLAEKTRLLAGTVLDQRPPRAIAALLDADGRLIDWHEKLRPVPAGERLPFLCCIPEVFASPLLDFCTRIVGFRPDLEAGDPRPPLRSADGVPFAALTCFDNAFESVARRAVQDGARLLVVLSNESWYRLGAELDQMLAMSVCRALETGTPIVRSTVDGLTCAIDARGRVIAALPRGASGGPRRLDLDVEPGPGALPPLAWLHDLVAALVLGSALLLAARRGRGMG
ncbi:MAG: apolipoprotein N-acyltransferase [Planctomycetes bacterium]|nr:apolipoprotein N-acyltransferase [Planctomycetota bacterium]